MFGGAAGFELSNQFIFRDVFGSQQRIELRGRLLHAARSVTERFRRAGMK
jgi:hypothetical protein